MRETWIRLTSLDAEFLFLLSLPFAVGLAGLAKLVYDNKEKTGHR